MDSLNPGLALHRMRARGPEDSGKMLEDGHSGPRFRPTCWGGDAGTAVLYTYAGDLRQANRPAGAKAKELLRQFKSFLTTSNALALAIGVIIGAAIGKVVASLVDDLIMPVVGLLLPSGDWREAKFVLKTATDAAGKITENAIRYGNFIGTLLEFLIIAFVVFLIVRALLKPAAAEPMKQCPECRENIPLDARRCRACATPL